MGRPLPSTAVTSTRTTSTEGLEGLDGRLRRGLLRGKRQGDREGRNEVDHFGGGASLLKMS